MAYVLSLRPQSPLKRSFSDNPYMPSACSSLITDNVSSSLLNLTPQNISVTSLTSLRSNRAGIWLHGVENAPPPLKARSLLDHAQEGDEGGGKLRPSRRIHPPTKRRLGRPPPACKYLEVQPDIHMSDAEPLADSPSSQQTEFNQRDPMANTNPDVEADQDISECFDYYGAIHIPMPENPFMDTGSEPHILPQQPPITIEVSPPPFRRWMSTLRRRHVERRKENTSQSERGSFDIVNEDAVPLPVVSHKPESMRTISGSLASSVGFVTAMKSASITIASGSIAYQTEMGGFHGRRRAENRSSNCSESRRSTDSNLASLGPVIDESAWLRSVQRRKIIEELLSSEESYIGDLKVLINDYFMLIASVPTLPSQTRASIHENISQILQLHQDLLNELHLAVPNADLTQSTNQDTYPVTKAKHIRFHSADMMPERFMEHRANRRLRHSLEIGRTPDRRPRALVADTNTVAQVAKIFNKYMKRFFAYEEYGAHWTTMSQDLTSMCRSLQGWHEYERGVEALSKVVSSENNREASSRKALSFSDLLIKPIQRVCKYPLLFEDLCRHTPVYDDPEAHAELEKALFRLHEAIQEVNKAKDDPKRRKLIETTWHLQDRLVFQEQTPTRALVFRLLGHVLLCGVLHVAYQGHDRVKGQYMVCVLYKSCLILATTNRSFAPYNVVAAIPLANGSLEESDNGRGLQCYTAPFTWKITFEHSHRLHEIILSACSSAEEEVWKNQLRERILCETHDLNEGRSTMQDMFSSLSLDVKSIGPVFGHQESVMHRMSVQRSATMGPKMHLGQVIIKNTQAQKTPEPPRPFTPNLVTRSQSLMSATSHIPTLTPRRAERIRLETALEEVWTKDILPYPGMGTRRTENPIRASANSVMRKLSMASIASNFSRRSPSFSSLSHTRSEESVGSFARSHKFSQSSLRTRSAMGAGERRPAPALVDFHNAPTAFLPADFEIQDNRLPGRRRRMGYRAMTDGRLNDRTPATVRPKRTRRLSTQIISLPRPEPFQIAMDRNVSETSSTGTVLYAPGPTNSTENRKRVRPETKEGPGIVKTSSACQPSNKKFLRSKSRIFKFWV